MLALTELVVLMLSLHTKDYTSPCLPAEKDTFRVSNILSKYFYLHQGTGHATPPKVLEKSNPAIYYRHH